MNKEIIQQAILLVQELNENFWDEAGNEDIAPFTVEIGYDGFRIMYEGASIVYSEDEIFYDDNDNDIPIRDVFIINWHEFKNIINSVVKWEL